MNKKPTSFCDRVLGFLPKGSDYLLVEGRPSPMSGELAGIFHADGVELQFVPYTGCDGAVSVWLSPADAKSLSAHLQDVLDELASLRGVAD